MNTTDDGPAPSLGTVLRDARAQSALSIRDLAEKSGLSIGQLSKLENDHVKTINPAHLAALAGPLQVPISRLYAAAGYTIGELADHEADLIEKLKALSPEAFQSVVDLVEDYLEGGPNEPIPIAVTTDDEPGSSNE